MEKYPESGRAEDAGEDADVGLWPCGCSGVDGGVSLSTTKVMEFILEAWNVVCCTVDAAASLRRLLSWIGCTEDVVLCQGKGRRSLG